MTSRARLILVGVALVSLLLTDTASVLARAGGGGSRGSRSYATPARTSSPASPTTPSSPSPALTQPSPSLQRPSFFGGLMGGIAGFALGGLLGSMLFGGMGGGFGGGIGLLELLLLGGATFFLFRLLRGRQATQPEPAYAGAGGASAYGARSESWSAGGRGATVEAPAGPAPLERRRGLLRPHVPQLRPLAVARWGSKTPQDIEEYWTFTRPVGPKPWRLSAIQTS